MSAPPKKSAILLAAKDVSTACKQLFDAAKDADSRYSLALICRRSGMPSRSTLSEAMRGRRRIPKKYGAKLANAFKLNEFETDVFLALLDLQHTDDADSSMHARSEVEKTRKALRVSFDIQPSDRLSVFAFKVFAAFGLFDHRPSRRDLEAFFGKRLVTDVNHALTALRDVGLVKFNRDRYEPTSSNIIFDGKKGVASIKRLLKANLLDTAAQCESWYEVPELARFHSTIVSVKRQRYESYIRDLRARLVKEIVDLEAQDGDMLVHFNSQIYPVGDGSRPFVVRTSSRGRGSDSSD